MVAATTKRQIYTKADSKRFHDLVVKHALDTATNAELEELDALQIRRREHFDRRTPEEKAAEAKRFEEMDHALDILSAINGEGHFRPTGKLVTCPHCGEPIDEAALKWLEEPLPTL